MDEALGELAACFRRRARVPDEELIRLATAARATPAGAHPGHIASRSVRNR